MLRPKPLLELNPGEIGNIDVLFRRYAFGVRGLVMPDYNTIFLEKKGDGETVVIRYTEARVPVKPIIASQHAILCSAFDNDFADKMMALRAGEHCSHTFPMPIYFERLPGNAWKVSRVREPA